RGRDHLAEVRLGLAGAVGRRGIEIVDAELECARDRSLALGGRAADEQPAHVATAETEDADAEPRPSKRAIVHTSRTSGERSYNGADGDACEVRIRRRAAGRARTRATRPAPVRRGAADPPRSWDRAPILRRPVGQQGSRRVYLPALRASALSLRDEVRVGHRLAVVLRVVRRRPHHVSARPLLWHGADGDPLSPLRRPSRPRVPRWAAAHGTSLLSQLRLARVCRRRPAARLDAQVSPTRAHGIAGGLIHARRRGREERHHEQSQTLDRSRALSDPRGGFHVLRRHAGRGESRRRTRGAGDDGHRHRGHPGAARLRTGAPERGGRSCERGDRLRAGDRRADGRADRRRPCACRRAVRRPGRQGNARGARSGRRRSGHRRRPDGPTHQDRDLVSWGAPKWAPISTVVAFPGEPVTLLDSGSHRPRAAPILARTREASMAHRRVSRRQFLIGASTAGAALALAAREAPAQKKAANLRLWILKTYVEPTNKAIEASAQRWAAKNGGSVTVEYFTFE